MARINLPFLSLFLLMMLVCTLTGGPTATPISVISPTAAIATSPLPTASPVPGTSPTPAAIPSPSPSHVVPTPSITATPAAVLPDDLPPEVILLLSPGPGSRVAGSITVSGVADSTFENNLVVEVRDVDGNILGVTPTTINAELGGRGPFEAVIAFDAPSAESPGRVVVYNASARDGHLVHLSSVVVTLLPAGSAADIRPFPKHFETLFIRAPALLDIVSGGRVRVSGFSGPTFEQTLQLAVLDENGVVVGSSFTTIQTEVGQAGPFEEEVPYVVASEQSGSIQVYATSPLDGSIEHLTSVEVILQP